jgi:hypothetical protein
MRLKFFLLLFSCQALAQTKEVAHQNLYWTRYFNQLTINKQWFWHNEIDNRRFLTNNRQHHLIMHTHLHYRLHPQVDVALGLTYSRQSPQFPDATSTLVVPEIRPFQELNFTQTFSKRFALSHRFRIDHRFFRKNNGKQLLDGHDFNLRFRYRFQATYLLSKIDSKNPITLKIADELFVNAGKNIVLNHFDQNRIYVGLEQALHKKFSAEVGYMHWFQQRNTGYQFFGRDILRLTVFHRVIL